MRVFGVQVVMAAQLLSELSKQTKCFLAITQQHAQNNRDNQENTQG
jgi:hypothetical protein